MKRTRPDAIYDDEDLLITPKPKAFDSADLLYPTSEDDKINTYRETNRITLLGTPTNYRPLTTFSAKFFPKDLLSVTKRFASPTPIQAQSWPILLDGRNVVGIAQTGSGKTLAYGLPGLLAIKQTWQFGDPVVVKMLVVAPTRELAMQIEEVLSAAGKASSLKVVCVYGGAPKPVQESALREGAHVVVATPGRLMDFLWSGICDLKHVNFLVLDEADRMLDMGFEPDIKKILTYIPAEHRTAMFSATWPKSIQKLSEQYIKDPVRVTIGATSGKLVASSDVTQIVEVIEDMSRDAKLITLLQKYHSSGTNRILIFVLYKKEAKRLESWLNQEGWKSVAIHSDKKQNQRVDALNAFKTARIPLLIATDVASRGLDIPQVTYVINYSFPLTVEDYVHRIGRTGRAGNAGIAHTFFQPYANKQHAGALVNVLKQTNQKIPDSLLQFDLSIKKKEPTIGKINIGKPAPQATHIEFGSSSSSSSDE